MTRFASRYASHDIAFEPPVAIGPRLADPIPTDPLERVLAAYDRGILACATGDFVTAHRAIGILRAALLLDSDASRAFDSLFAWCERAIDRGHYSGASRCLAALRGAWECAAASTPLVRQESADRALAAMCTV